ncbi:MAG: cation transporter [Candidatus Nitricoxidivorans perseverans]|uniref:Cation transporter n=1 Tax=Candidatus Nitricoxidivorans perseverans TaxID=2975601 RepID=A0AA49FLE1_9PROT|nr:MAG: cation transporter [Candidatus Nitricoxidivorans perseverans]
METTTIQVSGMSCGGCVKSVTKVLSELPGVLTAEVTLQPGEAKVEFDPARVTREAMAQAIEDAGFGAA